MIKGFVMHGLVAAVLTALAAYVYNFIYCKLYYVDFSALINSGSILAASASGSLLIASGDFIFFKWKGNRLKGFYNLLVLILSFVSGVGVLSFSLPLNISFPELFPGLAIPMHFFPALSYFSLAPFFRKTLSSE